MHKKTKILFICHGTVLSGLGHIMRSAYVAHVCAQYVETHIVVLGTHELCKNYEKNNANFYFLTCDEELIKQANIIDPDCICFDMLSINDALFKTLKQNRLTTSLSPVFSHLSQVDVLFHRTQRQPTSWDELPDSITIYKGLEYAAVDARVEKIPTSHFKKLIQAEHLSVGISMGGTDSSNKTLRLLNTLREFATPSIFWVLLGEGYAHNYESLVNSLNNTPHEALFVKSSSSMWHILQQCSFVFLAGGVTTFEAVYAGLPSVNLIEDESRIFLLDELLDKGALRLVTGSNDEINQKALLELSYLDANRDELLQMHQASKKIKLDKDGTVRLVKTLLHHILQIKVLNE